LFSRYGGTWSKEDTVDHPQKPSQTAAAAAGAAAWQTPSPEELPGKSYLYQIEFHSPQL